MPSEPLPLRGVRVLDFTRILSGPYCSLLLADMGADVVKVERADRGDDTRGWAPVLDEEHGISTYFAALNRGKRSVAVDFRAPGAPELLARLASRADVVLENFRPGVAASLGLDPETLAAANPALVVCSISGFGRTGPYADYPGTEIVTEGMTGLMAVTGPADGEPARFGVAMIDIATGLTGAARILAALLEARATGRGAHVEVSLYGTALGVLGTLVADYSLSGVEPRRWGSHHPSLVPYGGFPTADGHLITGVLNDGMWPAFCEALELDELVAREDYRTMLGRVRARAEVEGAITASTRRRPTAYWLERLRERGLLGAPVRGVGEALEDPATEQSGLLVGLEGYPGVVATRLDNVPREGAQQPVPQLGEHTHEVLASFGLTDPELEALAGDAVIPPMRRDF